MSDSETQNAKPSGTKRGFLVALPLLLFAGLAGLFFYALHQNQLGRDITEIPSVLIDKAAPNTVLPPLEGLELANGEPIPALDMSAPHDKPMLVNVFASWCGPCRQEHPLLMELAKDDRIDIVAINYKDKPANARGFLESLGNPYDAIGVDQKGAATIDWGVYGVPESFLVSTDGRIVYKQTGPFSEQSFRQELMPALEKLLEEGGEKPAVG
ncbi:putative thiol:disulfide interchange protein (cytochrome c biogenesis protein) [Fulvimarina pelagi HTCC2506]|uniref:Putative thiol:disulfide interchange protein (Cytochrome c biogenesis protein) n=1 Tax=Fulvimarina pelagi HTCC2506 TaxID=314231 RepID=Q0G3F4_9HYPH|nr:DsbE family thiol:disulfide interchange protein [Fulvimarina pelagi]EAU41877.1 putative thiol:disulfide interchange protein (cytochrome c biogenesis protein) [Fulvimarina pelagi HTCC2506]